MNPDATLFHQGILICAVGGLAYGIMMIVIFVKARRAGVFKPEGKTKTSQVDQYWLEEDGQPTRYGPGASLPRSEQSPPMKPSISSADDIPVQSEKPHPKVSAN